MQINLQDLIDEKHILVEVQANDAREAIRKLTEVLADTDTVSMEFAEDVWDREENYPTGLPTEPIAVAIPHADPDHVIKSGICFGILEDPVQFAQMGTDGSTKVEAKIVILLAIKEKEKQAKMIQQLMGVVQNKNLLNSLMKASDSQEAYRILNEGT